MRDNLRYYNVKTADIEAARSAMGGKPPAKVEVATPKPRAKSLAVFRKEYDVPQKIRDHLADMTKDTYVTEEELRQLCEVPVQNWRRSADLPEFSSFKFKLEGVIYWAPVETIRQMKQITGRA